jgi:hypothetical protein
VTTAWARASHAQRGKALDDARGQVADLIDALNLSDPVEAAVVLGLDHLIGLVSETLAYRLGDKPRRDFGAVNDVTLTQLANLKEATMPVSAPQLESKLDELQIAPPSEPSPHERVVIPGGIRECIVLRARGVGARLSQKGELTVAASEMSRVARLGVRVNTETWLEDGRRLIGRGA